ncbi:hypothetical protein EJB05_30640, partial [Eragrostis curvula]
MTEAEATSNQEDDAESDTNVSNEDAMVVAQRRGMNMEKGLDKMTKELCVKIPLHISEGKRHPEAPMQAAKFASEGGIILRQHTPILPH